MPKPALTWVHPLEEKTCRGTGSYETSIIEIPLIASNSELQITRHNWPIHSETVIQAQLWVSYNSGRKWHLLIGFTAHGGQLESSVSSSRRKLKPQYKTHKRLLKALIACKIPLTIETKIEVW
jgi:hypothetical protein